MRISDWSSDVCSSDLRWKRRARSLVALLLLAGMAWAAWIWRPVPPVRLPLVHVIDGDSLTLQRDGETLMIRLTGLDAVEYRQDCARADGARWACRQEARAAPPPLAGRGPLLCDLAAQERDGRKLGRATVWESGCPSWYQPEGA